MKKILLVIIMLMSGIVSAQTAKEIIEKNI